MINERFDDSTMVPTLIQRNLNWGDQDSYRHANNSIFLRWFETSWATFLLDAGFPNLIDVGHSTNFILISVQCNFKRQIQFPDRIAATCSFRDAKRSFVVFAHNIWSYRKACICAQGSSKVVLYDRKAEAIRRLDQSLIERLMEFQEEASKCIKM